MEKQLESFVENIRQLGITVNDFQSNRTKFIIILYLADETRFPVSPIISGHWKIWIMHFELNYSQAVLNQNYDVTIFRRQYLKGVSSSVPIPSSNVKTQVRSSILEFVKRKLPCWIFHHLSMTKCKWMNTAQSIWADRICFSE